MAKKTAIIGYGSDIRNDDVAGFKVVRDLKRDYPDKAVYLEGYNTVDLLDIMPEHDRMIIIDCAFLSKKPGYHEKRSLNELDLIDDLSFSHEANFKKVVPLAESMGIKVPEILFFLIQPKDVNMGERITRPVKDTIEKVKAEILKELD